MAVITSTLPVVSGTACANARVGLTDAQHMVLSVPGTTVSTEAETVGKENPRPTTGVAGMCRAAAPPLPSKGEWIWMERFRSAMVSNGRRGRSPVSSRNGQTVPCPVRAASSRGAWRVPAIADSRVRNTERRARRLLIAPPDESEKNGTYHRSGKKDDFHLRCLRAVVAEHLASFDRLIAPVVVRVQDDARPTACKAVHAAAFRFSTLRLFSSAITASRRARAIWRTTSEHDPQNGLPAISRMAVSLQLTQGLA